MGFIGVLCLLLIVLIAVISSKEIKRKVGHFAEVIVFRVVPYFLKLMLGILAIVGICMLTNWVWVKLHQMFPKMWSLGEIIGIVVFFIAIVIIKIGIDTFDKKLKSRYSEHKVQKIYDTIGIVIKNFVWDGLILGGLFLVGASIANFFYSSNNLVLGDKIIYAVVLVLFTFYLITKYFVIRKMRKHISKKTGFWVCIFLGLFFSVGGLVASKLSLLDFCLNPAGVLGIILLVWAIIIKKRERK